MRFFVSNIFFCDMSFSRYTAICFSFHCLSIFAYVYEFDFAYYVLKQWLVFCD